jgi:hypothetical protein
MNHKQFAEEFKIEAVRQVTVWGSLRYGATTDPRMSAVLCKPGPVSTGSESNTFSQDSRSRMPAFAPIRCLASGRR